MERKNSISDFIFYKHGVEKRYPMLTSNSRIITIDGIDGSGKTTLSSKIYRLLSDKFGEGRVELILATNLQGSPDQRRLKVNLEKIVNIDNRRLDLFYCAGVNRAYHDLVNPAIEENKIVVIDRSELDLLRYSMEKGDKESLVKRMNHITQGTLTHRLWAGNRVFLKMGAKDIWQNLLARKENSSYDPKSLEEVEQRIRAQEKAEETILQIPCLGEVNKMSIFNVRVDNITDREKYLNEIAKKIIERLIIPDF